MSRYQSGAGRHRSALWACTAITAFCPTSAAHAQAEGAGLQEIIVTAQKREQSLQDVPVAVTALGDAALRDNRVQTVRDLSGLVPGLTVAEAPSGDKIPSFTIRGAVSTGVVPGSDKQVSLYLDGVYLSSPRGSVFDLPDVDRIEVLRGPQGTLFGRNATAGAVSISTRDPGGEVGVRASVTVGNQGEFRYRTSVDFPQIGPFSAYVSYMHRYRRGDIRNLGAGQLWDRTLSKLPRLARVQRSPEYLGSTDTNTYFAAIKFESGDFVTTYKFDHTDDVGTPNGTGFVGYDPNTPGLGPLLTALLTSQSLPVPLAADGKRPRAVSNPFVVPTDLTQEGHSVTSTYQLTDALSIKNVFAYRRSFVFGTASIDGVSSLTFTAQALPAYSALTGVPAAFLAPLVGSPIGILTAAPQTDSRQYSDELQVNYTSDFLAATVGALWFRGTDRGNQTLFQNNIQFAPIPGGVIPNAGIGQTYNKATSLAAYAQVELHLTPEIDIIAGGRITRDEKSGTFIYGDTPASLSTIAFGYKKAKPSYLIGVNYKPTADTLLYAKFSTAYVSGGSVARLDFAPETAKSWESGVKIELFDRKLRTNLALFLADYKHNQGPQSPSTPGSAEVIAAITGRPELVRFIGTYVGDLGNIRAKGFELEVTAAPVEGVTLSGGIGFADTAFTYANPVLVASQGGRYELIYRPKWAGSVAAQYDTPPIGRSVAYMSFRVDGTWQSAMNMALNPDAPEYQTFARGIRETPQRWQLNGRVSLRELDLGGVKTELAVWGKNLANNRSAVYSLNLSFAGSANYVPARAYGVDLSIAF